MSPPNWITTGFLITSTLLFSCSDKSENNASTDSNLRILTYNVWYGFTKVPERKTLWISWMKEQKPDIVFLQELNEYTADKLEQDAANWGHVYSVLLKPGGFPTGMTSRYPIQDVQRITEGFHHGLIRAKVNGIYFYTIHLHPSNWVFRNKEIDLILSDMQGLPSQSDIILAGDFNTFSAYDSSFYSHKLLEPFFSQRDQEYEEHNLNNGQLDYTALSKLIDYGFTDTEHLMRKDEYIFTGSFPALVEKPGDHGSSRRLDYVFASTGLVPYVQRAAIIANDTTQFLSDHLPVIVDFSME